MYHNVSEKKASSKKATTSKVFFSFDPVALQSNPPNGSIGVSPGLQKNVSDSVAEALGTNDQTPKTTETPRTQEFQHQSNQVNQEKSATSKIGEFLNRTDSTDFRSIPSRGFNMSHLGGETT